MKLTLCIPTHHGRAGALRQLLDSIVRQRDVPAGAVEICVSDNASHDGTARVVAEQQRASPFPIRYFRFETDMRGVRNFANVVAMSRAEYCWLIGSDDIVLDGALAAVLRALQAHPGIAAASVNKLNMDSTLEQFVGPDASVILPAEPGRTRVHEGTAAIVRALGIPFSYMSAHVFRRAAWDAVLAQAGIETLVATRHFPHTYVLCQIARREPRWLWIGEYCVVQRLGNFCLMEEKGQRQSLYAMEVLEDLDRVWASAVERDSAEYASLMRRHFLFYWNPFCVRAFKCEPGLTREEDRAMRALSKRCFRRAALYWLTSYPVLLMPAALLRFLRPYTSRRPGSLASRSNRLRRALAAFGIENAWTRQFDRAQAAARRSLGIQAEGG